MADLLELCSQAGLDLKRQATCYGGEYAGSCPKCGDGRDRFRVWPKREDSRNRSVGIYWCRHCETSGDSYWFCVEFLSMTREQAEAATNAKIPLDSGSRCYKLKDPKAKAITAPPELWRKKAEGLVAWAHEQLLNMPYKIDQLNARGLPLEAIKKYRLGYVRNPKGYTGDFFRDREDWGLEPEKKPDGKMKRVWIPEGILIPMISTKGAIDRLIVRRTHWKEGDDFPKYAFVSGGMSGLVRVGDRSLKIVVVVESELDALAGHYVFGDQALFVAIGGNTKTPDALTNRLMLHSDKLLVCHDRDEGGEALLRNMREKLRYPHVEAYPTPEPYKDIGEAAEDGLNIREWLLSALEIKE